MTGLRVSKAFRVKIEHFDFNRKIFMIRNVKGQKDRKTIFLQKIIDEFIKYNKIYFPVNYIFYFGKIKSKHISKKSIEKIFIKYKKLSKINSIHTVHSLRHSFAIYLLESGTDIRYI